MKTLFDDIRDDRDSLFLDWGVTVIYKGIACTGIFYDDPELVSLYVDSIETSKPMLEIKKDDVPDIRHGSIIEVNDKQYSVIGIQDDGYGVLRLILTLKV